MTTYVCKHVALHIKMRIAPNAKCQRVLVLALWLVMIIVFCVSHMHSVYDKTRMWANAQRYGRPAERRWRPVFNAAKFGLRPLLDCRAVTLVEVS